MNPPLQRERTLDAIERQALAWVRRVASGEMTPADGAALRRWCMADPAHKAAFAVARQRWQQLGEASQLAVARNPASLRIAETRRTPNWQRRAISRWCHEPGQCARTTALPLASSAGWRWLMM
ncbi:Fe2+-dicitrate sensor, membrane protein [Cupriavidus basilensis OR16]|uniref:Fe2+-dicitrate sensor, membrane protein n=1 Tax=Cupriavidus basilensis OR16 TaxID=1127483 RepID=H1S6C4_9BURK|nr:DUF4880 domain-containing protein [Cupriavidus basilensis]EHP41948.1 Fe2+-dicitrate sensor, membrane protein [Cupriavidus basilensis OR16]